MELILNVELLHGLAADFQARDRILLVKILTHEFGEVVVDEDGLRTIAKLLYLFINASSRRHTSNEGRCLDFDHVKMGLLLLRYPL